jgi:hypothetical protein
VGPERSTPPTAGSLDWSISTKPGWSPNCGDDAPLTRHRKLQAKRTDFPEQPTAVPAATRSIAESTTSPDRIASVIDHVDPIQKPTLLRLLMEEVRLTGWHIEIRLRIALDQPPPTHRDQTRSPEPDKHACAKSTVSSQTVCVPFVTINGPSYLLKDRRTLVLEVQPAIKACRTGCEVVRR